MHSTCCEVPVLEAWQVSVLVNDSDEQHKSTTSPKHLSYGQSDGVASTGIPDVKSLFYTCVQGH